MVLSEVSFATVAPPFWDRKQYKKYYRFFGFGTVLLLALSLTLTILLKTGIFFYIALGLLFLLGILAFRADKKLFLILPKGTLTLNPNGISIQEENGIFIPYEEIKSIRYEYDRPRYSSRYAAPPAGTYKFSLTRKNNTTVITYIHYPALQENKNGFTDFAQVMLHFQKTNRYFYEHIRYYKA